MRHAFLGTARFFNTADAAGGGAPAPVAPVVDPAAVVAGAPEQTASVEQPKAADVPAGGAAPAADAGVAEPAKLDAHAEPTMLEGTKIEDPTKPAAGAAEGAKPGDAVADPAKPADQPKAEEAKASDPAKSADGAEPTKKVEGAAEKPGDPPPAAPEPIKYEFKLPEGVKIDEKALAPAIDVLREAGVKPEQAQKLMDQHVGAMQALSAHVASEQQRVWQETRAGWRNEVMADPQIGGAGHQTAMQAIARMRDTLVHPNDMSAFNDFLRVTGAGDHPAFLKLLHNASRYLDEPAGRPADGAPPPDAGKRPGKQGLRGIYKDNEAARRGA